MPATAPTDSAAASPRSSRWPFLVVCLLVFVLLGGAGLAAFFFLRDENLDTASAALQLPEPNFKPPPPRPLISLSAADEARVEKAITQGVAYLKKSQTADGTWLGPRPVEYAALAGMTLLECGVPAADPVIKKAADYVRKQTPAMSNTYGIALYLLFLNKLSDSQDRERIKELALRLVAGQTPHGGWDYGCPVLPASDQEKLLTFLRSLEFQKSLDRSKDLPELLKTLPAGLQRLAFLADPTIQKGDYYRGGADNSNTQFALLALWAARGRQLPVDKSLEHVVRRFRHSQNDNGSWNYRDRSNASPLPTMTCAGLLGLAVGLGLDLAPAERTPPGRDPAMQKAIKHLSDATASIRSLPSSGKPPMHDMYFLWSIERVGVLFHLRRIGDLAWYQWGMNILLPNQNNDGSWHGGGGHGSSQPLDTCFALLFLQRANLAQDLTDKIQEMFAQSAPSTQKFDGK
ncbi:MAG: terpene cyclase/mutase family protein [Planctomycetes bacterium]|nr:terpene cyclase/mutase family protein [Planctomycetota bacterium]